MEIKIELTAKEIEEIICKEMLILFPGKFPDVTIKSYGGAVVEIMETKPVIEKEGE